MQEEINNIEVLRKNYVALEQQFSPHGNEFVTYDTPVNFKEALNCPVHRWYAYKEGFSPSFVRDFIKRFSKSSQDIVFDPYGGVGTTVLVANEMGMKSFSLDVSPLGNFASRVKNASYTAEDVQCLNHTVDCFQKLKNFDNSDNYNINPTVISYFAPSSYDAIIQVKNFIGTISNKKVHDIFLLSLLSILEGVSTHRKNGNGVKKKSVPPSPSNFIDIQKKVLDKITEFQEDIAKSKRQIDNLILDGSCLEQYMLPQKANVVITSPPYANCFDYSKVYLIELWMGGFFCTKSDQQQFRESSVISHVHYRWSRNDEINIPLVDNCIVPLLKSRKLWSNSIPNMIKGYFHDMYKCLKNLSENIEDGANVGFVVGNPTYAGVVIATDLLLADIATSLGYECVEIKVYRKIVPSSQQTKLIDDHDKKYVRESLVILQWKK